MHIAPSKRLKNQLYSDVCVCSELFYNIMRLIIVYAIQMYNYSGFNKLFNIPLLKIYTNLPLNL